MMSRQKSHPKEALDNHQVVWCSVYERLSQRQITPCSHPQTHIGKQLTLCEMCVLGFPTQELLEDHLLTHNIFHGSVTSRHGVLQQRNMEEDFCHCNTYRNGQMEGDTPSGVNNRPLSLQQRRKWLCQKPETSSRDMVSVKRKMATKKVIRKPHGKRVNDVQDKIGKPKRPCPFCGIFQAKLMRHLLQRHEAEEEMQIYFTSNLAKQKQIMADLRKRGIVKENERRLKGETPNRKPLLRERRQGSVEPVMCPVCCGYFSPKFLRRHTINCKANISKPLPKADKKPFKGTGSKTKNGKTMEHTSGKTLSSRRKMPLRLREDQKDRSSISLRKNTDHTPEEALPSRRNLPLRLWDVQKDPSSSTCRQNTDHTPVEALPSRRKMPLRLGDDQKDPSSPSNTDHTSGKALPSRRKMPLQLCDDQKDLSSSSHGKNMDHTSRETLPSRRMMPLPAREDRKELSSRSNKGRPERPCPYCGRLYLKLKRHLLRMHKKEEALKTYFSSDNGDRKHIISKLRKQGIMKENYKRLTSADDKAGPLLRERHNASTEVLMCIGCCGFFSPVNLYKHRKNCTYGSKRYALHPSSIAAASKKNPSLDQEFQVKVLQHFHFDRIDQICREDDLILRIGLSLWYHPKKKSRKSVMLNMKRLANLLKLFRSECQDSSLEGKDLLDTNKFPQLERSIIKQTTGEKNDLVQLKTCLGHLLKRACKLMKGIYLINNELDKGAEIDRFSTILDLQWKSLLSQSGISGAPNQEMAASDQDDGGSDKSDGELEEDDNNFVKDGGSERCYTEVTNQTSDADLSEIVAVLEDVHKIQSNNKIQSNKPPAECLHITENNAQVEEAGELLSTTQDVFDIGAKAVTDSMAAKLNTSRNLDAAREKKYPAWTMGLAETPRYIIENDELSEKIVQIRKEAAVRMLQILDEHFKESQKRMERQSAEHLYKVSDVMPNEMGSSKVAGKVLCDEHKSNLNQAIAEEQDTVKAHLVNQCTDTDKDCLTKMDILDPFTALKSKWIEQSKEFGQEHSSVHHIAPQKEDRILEKEPQRKIRTLAKKKDQAVEKEDEREDRAVEKEPKRKARILEKKLQRKHRVLEKEPQRKDRIIETEPQTKDRVLGNEPQRGIELNRKERKFEKEPQGENKLYEEEPQEKDRTLEKEPQGKDKALEKEPQMEYTTLKKKSQRKDRAEKESKRKYSILGKGT